MLKHQPVPHGDLPSFFRAVWDPVRLQAMISNPVLKVWLEARVTCAEQELITPDMIRNVKVTTASGASLMVAPQDPIAKAKRSAVNPPNWVLEPKGLKGFVEYVQRLAGDKPLCFGGHHQSRLARAADRAATEKFLCQPFERLNGFQ